LKSFSESSYKSIIIYYNRQYSKITVRKFLFLTDVNPYGSVITAIQIWKKILVLCVSASRKNAATTYFLSQIEKFVDI
jgi:hypothetical protein